MKIRPITLADADDISSFLALLTAAGKRTLPDTADYVRDRYTTRDDNICCHVAEDDTGAVIGMQVLIRAADRDGWGLVGTHVDPNAARRGIGKALFAVTRQHAIAAGLAILDATIGRDNDEGLAYYSAIGFETFKTTDAKISKCYDLTASGEPR